MPSAARNEKLVVEKQCREHHRDGDQVGADGIEDCAHRVGQQRAEKPPGGRAPRTSGTSQDAERRTSASSAETDVSNMLNPIVFAIGASKT